MVLQKAEVHGRSLVGGLHLSLPVDKHLHLLEVDPASNGLALVVDVRQALAISTPERSRRLAARVLLELEVELVVEDRADRPHHPSLNVAAAILVHPLL